MGRKVKGTLFKVTKDDVNNCYAKLIKRNFRREVQNDLIDFDIEYHTDTRITNKIYAELNNYVNSNSNNLNVLVEKIRVEHIIDTYKSGVMDKKEFGFNFIGIYVAILCVFVQSWIEGMGKLPVVVSTIISAVLFVSIICIFDRGADEIRFVDDESTFENNFELLFYTLYLNVLNTYNYSQQ